MTTTRYFKQGPNSLVETAYTVTVDSADNVVWYHLDGKAYSTCVVDARRIQEWLTRRDSIYRSGGQWEPYNPVDPDDAVTPGL